MPFPERLLHHWASVLREGDVARTRTALGDMKMFVGQLTAKDYEKFGLIGLLGEHSQIPEAKLLWDDYKSKMAAAATPELEILKAQVVNLEKKLEEAAQKEARDDEEKKWLKGVVEDLERSLEAECSKTECQKKLEQANQLLRQKEEELSEAHKEISRLLGMVIDGKEEATSLMEALTLLLQ
uniref:MT domain-containing protein n=1 Tax=Steinernema glaseri TaxID=37863 RepID=A0A1I7ZZW1_9BILA